MNWYKQADFSGRDPFKVDFAHEEAKAKMMETDNLIGALSDAIEASQVSSNQGKYTDQASIYRKELLSRGISIEQQDAQVKETPSLHWEAEMNSQDYKQYGDGYQVEDTSPCKDPLDRPRMSNKDKGYQSYPNRDPKNAYNV